MKTELALLLTHDKPIMTAAQVADLLGITERSLENQIYAERCPIPMFKVGSKYAAHITDVAGHVDRIFPPEARKHEVFVAEMEKLRSQIRLIRVKAGRTAWQRAMAKRTPAWADRQAIHAIYRQAQALTRCTGIQHQVDHVIPLRGRNVSGLHVASNLQILTKQENGKKRNLFEVDHE